MVKLDASRKMRRAQQVLLEIARQSIGDAIIGKTKLFKTFYFAHLYYAKDNPGYLTEWPIVRMPNGPGIDQFDLLIDGLVREGLMICTLTSDGPYPTTRYQAVGVINDCPQLTHEEIQAIARAVEYTKNKTAAQLSQITHEYSHSWNDSTDGEELNIYRDLLDEDADKTLRNHVAKIGKDIESVFGS